MEEGGAELRLKLELQKIKLQFADCDEYNNFMDENRKFLDVIMGAKHCRKCREHEKRGRVPVNHHRNVVWTTAGGLAKSEKHRRRRPCKYVLFQEWLDFLVQHKSTLAECHVYRDQLKETLETIHNTNLLLPPFDWHYWQFFQTHLPLINFTDQVTEHEQGDDPEQGGVEDGDAADNNLCENELPEAPELSSPELPEAPGSENHCRDFLLFFTRFFLEEYDLDSSIGTIEWDSDLIMDLYMDPLGLINLGEEITRAYPDAIKARFGEVVIPFEFLFQKLTIRDLYENLFCQ